MSMYPVDALKAEEERYGYGGGWKEDGGNANALLTP
jgi:hypothetical protein